MRQMKALAGPHNWLVRREKKFREAAAAGLRVRRHRSDKIGQHLQRKAKACRFDQDDHASPRARTDANGADEC